MKASPAAFTATPRAAGAYPPACTRVLYTSTPMGLIFVRNPAITALGRYVPAVVGKSDHCDSPATYAFPLTSTAIAYPKSSWKLPRYVE